MRKGKSFEIDTPCLSGETIRYTFPDNSQKHFAQLIACCDELADFTLERAKIYFNEFLVKTFSGYPAVFKNRFGGFTLRLGKIVLVKALQILEGVILLIFIMWILFYIE